MKLHIKFLSQNFYITEVTKQKQKQKQKQNKNKKEEVIYKKLACYNESCRINEHLAA